jgi:hypothetical protein
MDIFCGGVCIRMTVLGMSILYKKRLKSYQTAHYI